MAALLNVCIQFALLEALFLVVLSDIESDITCHACRENRGRLANNRKSKMTAPSQECDISQNPRLDYQPLFGKMSPHSSPGEDQRPDPGDGGNRAYQNP